MVKTLTHKEGSKRAFAAQMLAHLAISDPDDPGGAEVAEKLMTAETDDEKTRAKQRASWRKATTLKGTNTARHDQPQARRS